MSVIFVILGFVLISLILVHVNLHQKKNELYKFIQKVYKTLLIRHKKITKIINLIESNEKIKEIKELSQRTLQAIEKGTMQPCQRIRAEVLLEEKMKNLISDLEKQELSADLKKAIDSYKKTQKRVNKNKNTYNEMIAEFMEACNIKPAAWYAAFEQIDTDYPRLLAE